MGIWVTFVMAGQKAIGVFMSLLFFISILYSPMCLEVRSVRHGSRVVSNAVYLIKP